MNENVKKENVKKDLMKDLEFKELVDNSEKLAKVNDLWYIIKYRYNAWIMGSC
ncbi:TPA: epipeptide YydF family RiPP [Staphylococcus aureus]|nr:epipeptide YydF family RiPP [Staphylococcus aureus]